MPKCNSDPTPEQIAERAAEIRATWSPERLAQSETVRAVAWQVPGCETSLLGDELDAAVGECGEV